MKETLKNMSFHEEVLQILPDAVVWARPVKNELDTIIDFEILFSNKKADDLIHHPLGSLTGLHIRRDGIPSAATADHNFYNFLTVYETGESKESTFYTADAASSIETVRRKFRDGVLSAVRDRKALREAERNEQEKTKLLDGIVGHAPIGILVYEALRDATGEIVDFKAKIYNPIVHQLTGIPEEDRKRQSLKELLNSLGISDNFYSYKHTAETGEPFSFEYCSPLINRWLHLSVVKLEDGFLAMLSDTNKVRNAQQALQQQTEYLDSILNASLNGIYVLDAVKDSKGNVIDFIFSRSNQKFSELTGKPVKEIIGKSFLTLFPHTTETGLFPLLCQVIEKGEPYRKEMYYAQSFQRWYDYMTVRLGENSVVATFQEVTGQRAAAIQIEQQKNLLDNILQHSPVGISVTEVMRDKERKIIDGRTILANEAAIKYVGIPKEDYLTKTVREIDPAIFDSPLYQMAIATLHTEKPFYSQYFFQPAKRWLELSVAKMDADHLINVFTDITETKETQLYLESLIEELKRTNANLEEFTYAASHDLKEPIRKIRTFSSRLKEKLALRMDANETDLFERMENSAIRMQVLVDDLLEYAHINQDQGSVETIDLNQKLQRVLQDLELAIEEKKAKIWVGPLPSIMGNRRQIQQLFSNLISNALKYSKREATPQIHILAKKVQGKDIALNLRSEEKERLFYLIEVKDNGIGFEQEQAERIFQVFQRLHNKNEYSGTGVGLSIVKKVIENHKGYIWAESEVGKGATFRVLLPAN